MKFDPECTLSRLKRPTGPVDVVLDTDTYNEADDQYALTFLLRSPLGEHLKAVYAAPFLNDKSVSAEDGMEKSYNEILNVLKLAGFEAYNDRVYKGSRAFLSSETEPVMSPAAEHLAKLAMGYTEEKPLYVIAIGAITNVASALLINPAIAQRIVLVWLGGHAWHWPDTREFNMMQDVAAARVVFNSGAAIVQLPCMGVVSAFTVTPQELETYLIGKNPIADYLARYTLEDTARYCKSPIWSRPIWDVTAVAWVLDWKQEWILDRLEHAPIPEYDDKYAFDASRPFMRYVYHINRDALARALYETLTK